MKRSLLLIVAALLSSAIPTVRPATIQTNTKQAPHKSILTQDPKDLPPNCQAVHKRSLNLLQEFDAALPVKDKELAIKSGGAAGVKIFNKACASVESELKASVANRKVPAGLVITYDDMHPLWGGTTIVIRGDGRRERRSRSKKESKVKVTHTTINQRQLLEFIQLLIRLKAWEQLTPQRQPVADESRATLTISVNGQASESWEWFNEISKNNRLIQIKAKMLGLK